MTFKDYFLQETLNECTSVGVQISGKMVIAKNRDRTYYPKIKLVRDIINGLEVIYMYDDDTDYSEGMNEAGIGIVNTTLQGKEDEKVKKNNHKRGKVDEDGEKIRKALGYSNPQQVIKILDLYHRGLGGHTIIGSKEGFYAIEKLHFGKPYIKKFPTNSVIVRANHGLRYPDQGYQAGKDRDSSLSRVFYANKEARKATTPDDLLHLLRKHHHTKGYLEPYRTNYKVWTSSQIMMNLTDLEMTFVIDENADFLGVENRLPKGYEPKIKLKIQQIETELRISSKEI